MELVHLDGLEPADLDGLGMGMLPRRMFEKALQDCGFRLPYKPRSRWFGRIYFFFTFFLLGVFAL